MSVKSHIPTTQLYTCKVWFLYSGTVWKVTRSSHQSLEWCHYSIEAIYEIEIGDNCQILSAQDQLFNFFFLLYIYSWNAKLGWHLGWPQIMRKKQKWVTLPFINGGKLRINTLHYHLNEYTVESCVQQEHLSSFIDSGLVKKQALVLGEYPVFAPSYGKKLWTGTETVFLLT